MLTFPRSLICRLLLGFILFCTRPFSSSAQDAAPSDSSSSCASAEYTAAREESPGISATTNSSSTAPSGDKVWSAPVVVTGASPLNTTKELEMGQQVTVCAMGLRDWIRDPKRKNDPTKLRLLIAGRVLSQPPSAIGPSKEEYVNFVLRLDSASSSDWSNWADIVDAARHRSNSSVQISLAVDGSSEVFESNALVKIVPYPGGWYIAVILGLFLLLFFLLLYLGWTSNMLRYTPGEHPAEPAMSPFSPGLVQMAVWFYLAAAAYVYIALTTHQINIPMGSVLGLLGISSVTGLAAVYVDKIKDPGADKNSLVAEQTALKARMKELEPGAAVPGSAAATEMETKKTRLAEVQKLIQQVPAPPAKSEGFVKDLLKDGSDYSFHRVQIFVWTIVLGAVFIWSVYRKMTMPEFDASLLTLMGISSGTYVGFKFPETPKTG
ncbi:MAG TPA: hypothetical protein VN861_17990 [Candidatus Acidoferrales bacterium]|nr:hypothetical protein [Candidatus Acidoferrales bacterium]